MNTEDKVYMGDMKLVKVDRDHMLTPHVDTRISHD